MGRRGEERPPKRGVHNLYAGGRAAPTELARAGPGCEMDKGPEEGEIWEWRGFGALSRRVAAAVRANPIRDGLFCHQDYDIYLVPPRSSQNVKIRKSGDSWFLKFKLLLTVGPRQIELYRESVNLMQAFPIRLETVREAARLLLTELPKTAN